MVSLKPKEGGSVEGPVRSAVLPIWIPVIMTVVVIAIGGIAYAQYTAKAALEERIVFLEGELQEGMARLRKSDTELASDIEVVTKHVGVTGQELASARKLAEKQRVEQEKALAEQAQIASQLASELATKASASEVAANVAAARAEAASKVDEVAKTSDAKITNVSGEVKTVATNLEATKQDLAASRRDLVDVRNTLSSQIAKNASELASLRLKGERDFVEFDLKKLKKNEMQRVGDIRLELRESDIKKQKYNIIIQVDDKKLEKKDRVINEPVQFLVGKEGLRYEIVVNLVEKDRVRGYLSMPKDKVLSAERPVAQN